MVSDIIHPRSLLKTNTHGVYIDNTWLHFKRLDYGIDNI